VRRPDLHGIAELGEVGIAELALIGLAFHGEQNRLDRFGIAIVDIAGQEHLCALGHVSLSSRVVEVSTA